MPELPEVETVVRGLKKYIVGKTIKGFEFNYPKKLYFDDKPATKIAKPVLKKYLNQIKGSKVTAASRRGKVIIIFLGKKITLLVHLKLTGQLILANHARLWAGGHPDSNLIAKMPTKHTHNIFTLSNGQKLYFNDSRKFGWFKFYSHQNLDKMAEIENLGIDALSPNFNFQYLKEITKKRPKKKIKELLHDQTLIAGIGNIYSDEALFAARIHPAKPAGQISDEKLKKLVSSIKKVLELSIKHGGSSVKDYVTLGGVGGQMQKYLKIYNKAAGEKCSCGGVIKTMKIGGRTSRYCPACQKL